MTALVLGEVNKANPMPEMARVTISLTKLLFSDKKENITRAAVHIAENMQKEMPPSQPIDLSPYQDAELLKQQYKQCILNEIKRKDRAFYDQWCHNENTCR